MFRLSLLALFAAVLFAQDPSEVLNRPPDRVDRALRQRITEFYQFHVKQEFRKAEALVAPDTKEYFYSHNKPAYLSCDIAKIVYTDKFKRAKATMKCSQFVMVPGFADKPLTVPFGSTWKVVDGKWYWYVDMEALRDTPFGKMTPGAQGSSPAGLPAVIPDNADFVMALVKADKGSVSLKPGQPETVTIRNGAPGIMNISLVETIPGVEAKLDHLELKVGDKAVLTLRAGDGARSGLISIKVEQTGQVIPIQVSVQ
ncbi:MAG: hypothetical protein LAQ69_07630 [Acidobacteriia bacterium]|nr:hypothetical protein [Terriglobia bacterium]